MNSRWWVRRSYNEQGHLRERTVRRLPVFLSTAGEVARRHTVSNARKETMAALRRNIKAERRVSPCCWLSRTSVTHLREGSLMSEGLRVVATSVRG